MVGERFFGKRIELAGLRVAFDLRIEALGVKFIKPVPQAVKLALAQSANCFFDIFDRHSGIITRWGWRSANSRRAAVGPPFVSLCDAVIIRSPRSRCAAADRPDRCRAGLRCSDRSAPSAPSYRRPK